MTAEFVILPSGRIQVMVGIHVVGTIEPYLGGARYRLHLPGNDRLRLVDSVAKGRRLILHILAESFEAAGPEFQSAAASISAQAESERAAA
jgi:hypothetical protein